jgi:hypothetical protein
MTGAILLETMAVRYLGHIRPQIAGGLKAPTPNKLITGGLKVPTLSKLITGGLKALNKLITGGLKVLYYNRTTTV